MGIDIKGAEEAIEETVDAFEQLSDAQTLWQQASSFDRLANAVSDLKTWHSRFNTETGKIDDKDRCGVKVYTDPAYHDLLCTRDRGHLGEHRWRQD